MADGVDLRAAELVAVGGHLRAAELMAAASAALSAAVDAVDAVVDPSGAPGLRTATRGRLVVASATADGARRRFVRDTGLPSTGADREARGILLAAELALQAERPEALELATHACKMCGNLSSIERSVFINASRGSISRLLASICLVGAKIRQDTTGNELRMVNSYKVRIQEELSQTCSSVLEVIEKYLLPNAMGQSSVVFYRMKGFCLAVISKINSTSPMYKMKAFSAYMDAIEEAERSLCITHPERLNTVLDIVRVLRDDMNHPEWAWQICRKTLDDVELSLSGLRMSTLPDESLFILNQIGEEIRLLSKEVAGVRDLVGPYIPATARSRAKKRKIDGLRCSSTGADRSAMLAVTANYIHPMIDEHQVHGEDDDILHPENDAVDNDLEQEDDAHLDQGGDAEDQHQRNAYLADGEDNAYLVLGIDHANHDPEDEAEAEALDTGCDVQSSARAPLLAKVQNYLRRFF